jgi:hypothetical protein
MKASSVLRSVGPREMRPFAFASDGAAFAEDFAAMVRADKTGVTGLERIGICGFTPQMVGRMMANVANAGWGMDAALPVAVTTASIAAPVQFLQTFLPGLVNILTQALKIDEVIGVSTVGRWQDEEIIQGLLENTGTALLYGDLNNVPYASWNNGYERRTIVRAEEGMRVGRLEELRSAEIGVNSPEAKRQSATLALDIFRNDVGFNGFNAGNGRTYGLLNDPGLNAALAFPATGSGATTTWSTKTFLNIVADIRLMISALRVQMGDNIDVKKVSITLALATGVIDFLSVTSDFGVSVQDWLTKTYPNIRVVSAPQFTAAIAGQNAAFMFAESVPDDRSTDDKKTWAQLVPTRFMLVGTSQQTKGIEEDYSNATAGVLLKRPYAVVRYYGN